MTKLALLYPLCIDKMSDVVSRRSGIYTHGSQKYVTFEVICPCCNPDRTSYGLGVLYVQGYIDNNNNVSNYDGIIKESFYKYFSHIENKIRLRGDKAHIDLLIKLVGSDKALEILDRWAKQNIIVADTLKNYVLFLQDKKNDLLEGK